MGIINAKQNDASLLLSLIDDISVLLENSKKKLVALYEDSPQNIITIHGMNFVHIPAGTFKMGSENGYDDERPCHIVTLTEDFYMTDTPITQAQYQAMMGENPSKFKGDDRPVERVSWHDATNFCLQLMDHVPYYTISLPTEAEWEYACQGNGSICTPLNAYAWYINNSEKTTHDVAQLKPNGFGLYDMLGNVWEWCKDKYDADYYASSPMKNPRCDTGSVAVLRGGGWCCGAFDVRAPGRYWDAPANRSNDFGFRCILQPKVREEKE